ncbi:MAG: AmmeMemoRadiSam system protein A [Gammaproteobacteria bacterium]
MKIDMYTETHKQQLLNISRASIRHGLQYHQSLPVTVEEYPEPLRATRATFVTLHNHAGLRGCIGTTTAVSPLIVSISENAYAAAFRDPRFKPLTEQEFADVHISISILTPSVQMTFTSETELLAQLRPGIDGLIIERLTRKATFLPSVWSSLTKPEDFLHQLKRKAGMMPDQTPIRAWRYQTETIE